MSSFTTFIKSFNNDNSKGVPFEKFCKWFLENDPVWKSQVKKVWLWDDWPGRWGGDLGIDLVFQHSNGETWAVQAKCYGQIYYVTKADIDKFLSESNRPKIHQRLLMASTDLIGPNARKVCAGQDKKVTFYLYSDFLDSKLDFPKDISKLGKAKLLPKPTPRRHQANALKDVIKGFEKYDRGQMIMACGTGKTFATLWIKEKLKAKSTLVLLPSLNLLSQTLKEWCSAANQSFQSLAVCSDQTVTKAAEEDSISESTQDLSFPVSSNPKEIAKFLKMSGSKVVFSTYQSSPMLAEAMKSRSVKPFDLVICDEAHRCVGKAKSHFTTILDDKKIKVKQKLFTTATPRTYSRDVKKAAKDNEIIITGMDDKKVFGPVFHKLSFGEAIKRKLLTDYHVSIVSVDEPMIKEWITDRKLLEVKEGISVDAESLAAQIGVLKAIKDYDIKRLISFHGRVKRAENFSKDILSVIPFIPKKDLPKGVLKSDYVSGQMPTNKRRQKLEQLKDLYDCDRQILSNARCLSEGVDVPALEGIAIIDPRKSQVDIVQTVGRAIRLSGNKKVGIIIIPVFTENSEDSELVIENSNFKPVYDVLNALKSHDENLAFELDELRTQMGRRKTGTGPRRKIPKVTIDFPKRLGLDFSESIKSLLIKHTSSSWFENYGRIKELEENFKDFIPVFSNFKKYCTSKNEATSLSEWVSNIRNRYHSTYLKIDLKQIQLLEEIRGWHWDSDEFRWQKIFEFVKIFAVENKHTFVPVRYRLISENPEFSDYKLRQWVDRQKKLYHAKNYKELPKYKINLIEKNIPYWTWFEESEYYFNKKFVCLDNFLSTQKRMPTKKDRLIFIDNKIKQHSNHLFSIYLVELYNNKTLGSRFIKKLNKHSFWSWSKQKDAFKNSVLSLIKYCKQNKDIWNFLNYKTMIKSDYNFYTRLSIRYRDNLLNDNEREILTVLPDNFYFDQQRRYVEFGLEIIEKYYQKNKKIDLNINYPLLNVKFRTWKVVIKKRWDNVDEDLKKRIEILPLNIFGSHEESWMNLYKELKEFYLINNHCNIPARYDKNQKLANWIGTQRKNYKKGKLKKEFIDLLDEINFDWHPKMGPQYN